MWNDDKRGACYRECDIKASILSLLVQRQRKKGNRGVRCTRDVKKRKRYLLHI